MQTQSTPTSLATGALFTFSWTEDDDTHRPQESEPVGRQHGSGKREPSPIRNALLAWSADDGKTWSSPWRVNSAVEAVQGDSFGPWYSSLQPRPAGRSSRRALVKEALLASASLPSPLTLNPSKAIR